MTNYELHKINTHKSSKFVYLAHHKKLSCFITRESHLTEACVVVTLQTVFAFLAHQSKENLLNCDYVCIPFLYVFLSCIVFIVCAFYGIFLNSLKMSTQKYVHIVGVTLMVFSRSVRYTTSFVSLVPKNFILKCK